MKGLKGFHTTLNGTPIHLDVGRTHLLPTSDPPQTHLLPTSYPPLTHLGAIYTTLISHQGDGACWLKTTHDRDGRTGEGEHTLFVLALVKGRREGGVCCERTEPRAQMSPLPCLAAPRSPALMSPLPCPAWPCLAALGLAVPRRVDESIASIALPRGV